MLLYLFHKAPFFWLFSLITILAFVLAIKTKKPKAKLIIANLIAIPLVIAVSEGVCGVLNFQQTQNEENTISSPLMIPKPSKYLGYTPVPDSTYHVKAVIKKRVIFDNIKYTIDKNGLRYTPSSNEGSNQCLLFLGCSYTFGNGLNDNETLPYFVGEKTHHKYKIYNFAYPGYGPQQMLSAIENGIVDQKIKNCKSTIAIYSGMPDHVRRIAGKKPWEKYDPKYSLVNNEAVYQGSFQENKLNNFDFINSNFIKVQTYVFVHNKIIEQKTVIKKSEEAQYEKLYIAILKKTKELVKQKYNADFIILFWDFNGKEDFPDYDFKKAFRENSLNYYPISSALPNFGSEYIRQGDWHPKKNANEMIADFLAKKLNTTKNQ